MFNPILVLVVTIIVPPGSAPAWLPRNQNVHTQSFVVAAEASARSRQAVRHGSDLPIGMVVSTACLAIAREERPA